MNIVSQPQSISLSGNIADIVFENATFFNFRLYEGGLAGTLLFDEIFFADEAGHARVKLREFIDQRLSIEMPGTNVRKFEQPNAVRSYTISIAGGSIVFEIVVIKGGADRETFNHASFLAANFLTWQMQTKEVKYVDPEFLTYYAQAVSTVKVKAYFSGGTDQTITLESLAAGKTWTLDVSFAYIRTKFTPQPLYFDVWVENASNERVTYVQRYVLSLEEFDYEDLFLFENSLGGLDTIRFTGALSLSDETTLDRALFDEDTFEYDVNPDRVMEKDTGFFRSEHYKKWTLDFFSSTYRLHLTDGVFRRVVLRSKDVNMINYELNSYQFVFAYTRQEKYLYLERVEDLPYNLEIIGPDDEVFFLAPRLSDFPIVSDPSSVLFPVQLPFTEAWRVLSYADILADLASRGIGAPSSAAIWGLISGNFTDQTDAIDYLNTNYYSKLLSDSRFAYKSHSHAIADINGLQLALDAKENAFTKNTAFNKNFGTTAGTVAQGNDSRINNGQTAFSWGNHANAGYAQDDEVVKLTGDQTVDGKKTFVQPVYAANFVFSSGAGEGGGTPVGVATWGLINGVFTDQTDATAYIAGQLSNYYTKTVADGRYAYKSHTHAAADIVSGVLSYDRLPISSAQVANWETAYSWGNEYLSRRYNTTIDVVGTNEDLNNLRTAVVYASTSAINKPPTSNSHILSLSLNSSFGWQMSGRLGESYTRFKENGNWSAWHRMWHSGNLTPSDYQLKSDGWTHQLLNSGGYNNYTDLNAMPNGAYALLSTGTNAPFTGFKWVLTQNQYTGSDSIQIIYPFRNNGFFAMRNRDQGVWGAWKRYLDEDTVNVAFANIGNTTLNQDYLFINRNSSAAVFYANQIGTGDIARFVKSSAVGTVDFEGSNLNGFKIRNSGDFYLQTTNDIVADFKRTNSNSLGFRLIGSDNISHRIYGGSNLGFRIFYNTSEQFNISTSNRGRFFGDLQSDGGYITGRLGIRGTYSSTEVQGIWSIGDSFKVSIANNDFGNQYGLVYAYGTTGGAPYASRHQILFVNNGVWGVAVNMTDGDILAKRNIRALGVITAQNFVFG